MRTHHYLGFERLVGESMKYVAVLDSQWVALIGWGTAAFRCASRDRWIGWCAEQQWRRLRFIADNQRFLVLPNAHMPNLASKALALNLRRPLLPTPARYRKKDFDGDLGEEARAP